jgi:hypothetical protein
LLRSPYPIFEKLFFRVPLSEVGHKKKTREQRSYPLFLHRYNRAN